MQGRPGSTYNLEGLESLAYNGQLDLATLIAKEGSSDFKAVQNWEFVDLVFPKKKALTFTRPPFEAAIVPPEQSVAADATPVGTHITSMEEIKALIRQDPHDPRVIVLLNQLKERMYAEGLSVEVVFADYFAANKALNERLMTKITFKQVGEMVRLHRWSALFAAILVDVTFAYTVVFSHGLERLCAAVVGILVTAALSYLAVYAYQIDRWLNLHPVLAVLIVLFCFMAGVDLVAVIILFT